ncbi:unnamed protein product [Ilex paraguariensis]|uniref:Uncharacterized protein n=1 Tax=Ilex paraguariensis TaxID=185542 RepID=A0ABC8UGC7_9AQUA
MRTYCAKFREKGLDHEDLMDQVLRGVTSTGANEWTPGENVASDPVLEEGSGESVTQSLTANDIANLPYIPAEFEL